MKKMICILAVSLLITGCAAPEAAAGRESESAPNIHLDDQSYYKDFVSEQKETSYSISGTLYQNNNVKGLVKAEALTEADLSISGSLTCEEGSIRLLCRQPDGTEITIAEGTDGMEQEISVNLIIKAVPGTNFFYFAGTDAVYDFQLDFGLSDDVSYYLTTSTPPEL